MSARRSYRIVSRRYRVSQASVRSTTHRCRPNRWLDSTPLRAIRTRMWRRCRSAGSGGYRRPCRHGPWRGACAAARSGSGWPGTASSSVLEDHAVVAVGARQDGRQRDATTIDDQVPFRARFAAIGGVRSHRVTPLLAGMLALSRLARSQSIRSASPSRSSRVRWRRSQTPACLPVAQAPPAGHAGAAAHFLGQHFPGDAGLQHEEDAGQTGAVRDAGSTTLGLRWCRAAAAGATIAHNSSETRGLLMPLVYHSITRF